MTTLAEEPDVQKLMQNIARAEERENREKAQEIREKAKRKAQIESTTFHLKFYCTMNGIPNWNVSGSRVPLKLKDYQTEEKLMVMITEWWREIERKWPGPHPPQILRSIKFKCPWYSDEWVCLKRGGVLGRFSWRWDFLLNRVYEYDGWEGECSFEVRVFMKTNRLPPPRRGRGGSGTPEEAIPLVEAAAPEDAIGLFAAGY